MGTYHDILGVKPDASEKELKAAWRRAVKQCHPDHHPDDPGAAAQFRTVNEAYESLKKGISGPVTQSPQRFSDSRRDHPPTPQQPRKRQPGAPGWVIGSFEDCAYMGEMYRSGEWKRPEPTRLERIKEKIEDFIWYWRP